MKKQRSSGITLIALVITIIVLLILAAVSAATLTGENGIITKAQEAKRETEIASIKEKIQTDILGKQAGNNGYITNEQLKTILNNYFEEVPEVLPDDLDTLTLTTKKEYGKYEIKVSDIYNGIIIEKEKPTIVSAKDISNSTDKDEYYGAIVTGYECTNSEAVNNWKIFYADENNIYLIADDYIEYNYMPNGKNGSSLNQRNTKYQVSLETVVSDYSGSSDITDKRIKALNNDYFTKEYTSTEYNMKAVAFLLDTSVWNVFAGETAEYAVGGPTLELLIKSYNQKHKVDYRTRANDYGGYQVSVNGGSNWGTVTRSEEC